MKARAAWLLGLMLIAGCGQSGSEATLLGYVEGDYVLVAPLETGRIEQLFVQRGATVTQDQALFQLTSTDARAERDQAAAQLARVEAQLADLQSGKRPQEIAVIQAQISEAETTLDQAARDLDRLQELADKRLSSASAVDTARAARDRAQARLAMLRRELDVAHLPARPDALTAAERTVAAARAELDRAEWRLNQRTVLAPTAGAVEDVLRLPGETAGPTAPVVSLLPPAQRTIRFFVPEPQRAALALGQRVAVACDGCPAELSAAITFIASQAEYTPPLIYSVASRQKLVFMVEARPLAGAEVLSPGQPVEVTLSTP